MKNRTFVIAAIILASSPVLAFSTRYSATLAQPVSKNKVVVLGYNAWRCAGSTCTLASAPSDPDSVRTCRQLQHEVGALTAYGVEGKQFDGTKLAACNATH